MSKSSFWTFVSHLHKCLKLVWLGQFRTVDSRPLLAKAPTGSIDFCLFVLNSGASFFFKPAFCRHGLRDSGAGKRKWDCPQYRYGSLPGNRRLPELWVDCFLELSDSFPIFWTFSFLSVLFPGYGFKCQTQTAFFLIMGSKSPPRQVPGKWFQGTVFHEQATSLSHPSLLGSNMNGKGWIPSLSFRYCSPTGPAEIEVIYGIFWVFVSHLWGDLTSHFIFSTDDGWLLLHLCFWFIGFIMQLLFMSVVPIRWFAIYCLLYHGFGDISIPALLHLPRVFGAKVFKWIFSMNRDFFQW